MWPRHDKPLAILAPMDGYTTPPYRRFIKAIEPRAIVFSEFLSAATVHGKPALGKDFFKTYEDEQPVVIQLYGKEPEHFRVAALIAEECGAAGIDVNMGCPAKKVVAHRHGSALMKEIDLACEIIATLKKALTVPVTVKTRLGWEDESNLIPFAKMLQDNGLDAIAVHGRTYSQKFDGEAWWDPIYDLKEALDIPVFGNGDIDSAEKARSKIGNLDGVMIGRAMMVDPWLIARVCSVFQDDIPRLDPLPFVETVAYWRKFARMYVTHGKEFNACCAFRKYLVRLHRDLNIDPEVRRQATSVTTLAEIEAVLDLFAASPAASHALAPAM